MVENIRIPLPSRKTLAAAVHYPSVLSDKLAILCPGHLDSKEYAHLVRLAEDFAQKGYTAVRFDFSGTWESEGSLNDYTITQSIADVRAVLEHFLSTHTYKNIVLGGHSRGGFISTLYAIEDARISTVLAIMSPYALQRDVDEVKAARWKAQGFKVSVRDIPHRSTTQHFALPYTYLEEARRRSLLDVVAQLRAPLILVAGELDDVVSLDDIRNIFAIANEPKQLIVMDGIGHDYRNHPNQITKVNAAILSSKLLP